MFSHCGNWFGYNTMNGWGGMGMMILWAILIIVIIYLISRNRANISSPYSNNNALNILQERYANGEISEEEFEVKKKVLNKKL